MIGSLNKNRLIRKSVAYYNRIPCFFIRLNSSKKEYLLNPPVLCNSFPKSGTHLLLQILEALPGIKNYGTFIASTPAITLKERSKQKHLRLIDGIIPGEVVQSHLYYSEEYQQKLDDKNCIHYFIYRDPRDVVVSDAYYLTYSYKIHRMHRYFAKELHNDEQRITAAIVGVPDSGRNYHYPDILTRFNKYIDWLKSPQVMSIRYEDLVGSSRDIFLRKIVHRYIEKRNVSIGIDTIIKDIKRNINPQKSHTFRKGGTGGWKNVFTEEQRELFKEICGDLLIELGYEKDNNW